MTERKPKALGFSSWVDQQIADAERRGVFDDLPGAGKPLNIRPSGGDYGDAWVRDYARREGVAAEEFLPTPLRLRREIERLAESAGEFRSEAEIREVAAGLNRRIVEWRRIPVGPPIHVRLVNADDMVAHWRAARQAAASASSPADAAHAPADGVQTAARQHKQPRWWRRRRQGSRPLCGDLADGVRLCATGSVITSPPPARRPSAVSPTGRRTFHWNGTGRIIPADRGGAARFKREHCRNQSPDSRLAPLSFYCGIARISHPAISVASEGQ